MSKQKSFWQHLLKVPSKDILTQLCHQAVLYKGVPADLIPEPVVADWSYKLSITKGETKQVIVNLSLFLQQALFISSADVESLASRFPSDVQTNLKELITNIVTTNFTEWRSSLTCTNTTLPRLCDVKCTVDSSMHHLPLDVLPPSQSNCMLQLKIEDCTVQSNTRTVNVQLSEEKLNAMLDGLGKIRNQLSAVTQG